MKLFGELPEQPGVYTITCLPTGKRYVGSTVRTLRKRFYEHRMASHRNPGRCKLHKAFAKYGADAFVFEAIECVDKDLVLGIEQFWINQIQPELNTARVAGNMSGFKHSAATIQKLTGRSKSEETKSRIRAARARQVFTPAHLEARGLAVKAALNKPIACSNGHSYPSLLAASAELDIPAPSICRVLTGYTANPRHKLRFWYADVDVPTPEGK
jgi:group I intron endonuclease